MGEGSDPRRQGRGARTRASIAGLGSFCPPDLEAVERRRLHLWWMALLLLLASAAGLALVASWGEVHLSDWLSIELVYAVLVGLVALFSVYAIDTELRLRRLAARLVEERILTTALKCRIEETTKLLEAGRAVNLGLDLDEVLERILACAVELLGASDGSVMLVHGRDELRTVCATGESGARGARVRFSEGIAGRVAVSHEPLLVQGTLREQTADEVPLPESGLCVPLLHREHLLGVLNVNGASPRVFTEHDLRALSLFGEHAATAIANAQLFETQRLIATHSTYHALHDALTGLPNRSLLLDRVGSALARRRPAGRWVSLLFIDIDDFKRVNDSLGHGAGDELLVAFAERLRGVVRAGDTVARFGGDEFVLLLGEPVTVEETRHAAERVAQAVDAPFEIDGRVLQFTCSVGIAVESEDVETSEALLRGAYTALHTAKAGPKGRVTLFEPSMRSEALERLDLEERLRAARDREQLVLHYQPIIGLKDGRVHAVEALLRWQHPERGLLSADQFVPLAEEIGLLPELDVWVLATAQVELASLGSGAPDLHVNVSPRSVHDEGASRALLVELERSTGFEGRIVLEVTESVLLEDHDIVTARVRRLVEGGARLALDDFGTGYCSLSYLRRLPVDVVKVDRLFVEGLETQPGSVALVQAIVRLGSGLAFDVVAEGIETGEQAVRLQELGCGLGQGFHFARPVALTELPALLDRLGRAE